MKTITKAQVVDTVFERIGGTRQDAQQLVELFFETIKEHLEKGEHVKISGFGNFMVRNKRPRRGRNPQTGEAIEISARRVLTFKPSDILRAAVNS